MRNRNRPDAGARSCVLIDYERCITYFCAACCLGHFSAGRQDVGELGQLVPTKVLAIVIDALVGIGGNPLQPAPCCALFGPRVSVSAIDVDDAHRTDINLSSKALNIGEPPVRVRITSLPASI